MFSGAHFSDALLAPLAAVIALRICGVDLPGGLNIDLFCGILNTQPHITMKTGAVFKGRGGLFMLKMKPPGGPPALSLMKKPGPGKKTFPYSVLFRGILSPAGFSP